MAAGSPKKKPRRGPGKGGERIVGEFGHGTGRTSGGGAVLVLDAEKMNQKARGFMRCTPWSSARPLRFLLQRVYQLGDFLEQDDQLFKDIAV